MAIVERRVRGCCGLHSQCRRVRIVHSRGLRRVAYRLRCGNAACSSGTGPTTVSDDYAQTMVMVVRSDDTALAGDVKTIFCPKVCDNPQLISGKTELFVHQTVLAHYGAGIDAYSFKKVAPISEKVGGDKFGFEFASGMAETYSITAKKILQAMLGVTMLTTHKR